MKKGVNPWIFPDVMPMARRMEISKRAGFDGFEILYETDGFVGLTSSRQAIVDVRKMADDLGIEIPSLCGTCFGSYMLTSGDAGDVHKFTEMYKKLLEAASILGADTALLVPGRVQPTRENAYGSYDVAYENALKNVAALADIAEGAGVVIGVENVWNKFLLSPIEFRAFIDAVNSKWIQMYFDVGNILTVGFPEQWIRIMGSRIKKVHIKDFKRDVGNGSGFVDLLAGDVDWGEVMTALREIGYDGYITAEVSPYRSSEDGMAYQTSRAMDIIFGM